MQKLALLTFIASSNLQRVLATAALAIASTFALAAFNNPAHAAEDTKAMKVRDLYPLITTPKLVDARNFYVTHFGFEVAFESSWFIFLTGVGENGATLAFTHPDHPSKPPGPESFNGLEMILTIEVSDAAAVYQRLAAGGADIVYPLADEDWGQRRFMTRDPAGVLVDVVEQIEPAPGFWDKYMK